MKLGLEAEKTWLQCECERWGLCKWFHWNNFQCNWFNCVFFLYVQYKMNLDLRRPFLTVLDPRLETASFHLEWFQSTRCTIPVACPSRWKVRAFLQYPLNRRAPHHDHRIPALSTWPWTNWERSIDMPRALRVYRFCPRWMIYTFSVCVHIKPTTVPHTYTHRYIRTQYIYIYILTQISPYTHLALIIWLSYVHTVHNLMWCGREKVNRVQWPPNCTQIAIHPKTKDNYNLI